MPDLLWKPPAGLTPGARSVAAPSRLRHFLGLSAALHLGVAALAPWLAVLVPSRADEELVRPIDFLPVADGDAGAGKAPGPAGAPAPPSGSGPPVAGRPVARAAPAPVRAPVRSEPAVPAVPAPAATEPPPPARATDIPVSVPKTVAAAESSAVVTPPPRPAAVASPSAGPAAVAPAEGADARLTAQVRDLVVGGGGDGPRATVAIPRELAGAGGGGAAGTGRGAGRTGGPGTATAPGPGAGGGATGPGAGDRAGSVDAGDPDFTEYFRTIERRVRAVWQFPRELQGTTQTVKLGFALRLDGTLETVRVLSSTSAVLNESAQSAMQRATPFPPLPMKFRVLAGQPLVMSFTVTVR
jgi:TonB family protein